LNEAHEALEARQDRLDDYGQSLMEHRIDVAKNDIEWLDRLISSEQKGSLNTDPEGTRRGK